MATSATISGRTSAHGNAGEASIFLVLANKTEAQGYDRARDAAEPDVR